MADSKPAALRTAGPSLIAEVSARVQPNAKLIALLAIGTGGVAATVLGFVADHHGVPTVLGISALLPLAGFTAARFLPAPRPLAQ